MDGGGLRTVLECVQRGESFIAAKRVVRMAMRLGKANNRFVIPVEYAIQQTHCPGVRNQSADFRFVDRRVHSQTCQHRESQRRHLIPKWIEIKPIVRCKPGVVFQAIDVTLNPPLYVFGAVVAIQDDFLGESLEIDLVALAPTIKAEE